MSRKSSHSKIIPETKPDPSFETISYTAKYVSVKDLKQPVFPGLTVKIVNAKIEGVAPGFDLTIEESKPGIVETEQEHKKLSTIETKATERTLQSKGMLKFGKNVTKSSPDHNVILEELLATQFARILGVASTNQEFVLVETTKALIKDSKKILEKDKPSAKHPTPTTAQTTAPAKPGTEQKAQAPKIEIFPALLARFEPTASSLSVAIAGNHPAYNQGHTKPLNEGTNSNQIVGKDYASLNILAFLTNDPDIIGKDGQNKMLLPNGRLFSIDTAVHSTRFKPGTNITIRNDGRLHSSLFDNRGIRDLTYLDELDPVRHVSFRNCSVTNDVSFSEMFNSIKDFFATNKAKEIRAEFEKARKGIETTDYNLKKDFFTKIDSFERDSDFMEKMADYNKSKTARKPAKEHEEFLKKIAEYKNAKEGFKTGFKQKQAYLQKINLLERDVENRMHNLYETFKPYWELYYKMTGQNIYSTQKNSPDFKEKEKNFDDTVQSLIALEELLSPSTMYSPEGIPLRAPEIPYEKHFFWHQETGWFWKTPNVSFDEKKQTVTIRLNNIDPEAAKRFRAILPKSNPNQNQFTCSIQDFKNAVTPDRVRLLTHPETLSLKTAVKLGKANKDFYMQEMKSLLRNLSSDDKKLAHSLFINYLTYTSKNYVDSSGLDQKSYESKAIPKFDELEKMYQEISKKLLLKNVIATTHPEHDSGWGKMIEIKAKVVKQQQYLVYRLIANKPEFKGDAWAQNILNIFEKADQLDISHSVNLLMRAVIKNPELSNDKDFKNIITAIMQAPLEGNKKYEEISENSARLCKEIKKFLDNPMLEIREGKEISKKDQVSEKSKEQIASPPDSLGLPRAEESAKDNLNTSVKALTTTGLMRLPTPPTSVSNISPSYIPVFS